ncbi:MAG: GtrA family protein [Bacteroidales bacterium]|nr:GtrA family protein [Bacteroidales bacterium]MDY6347297.1 GtrA family protein [Bacteroidales bacterium]
MILKFLKFSVVGFSGTAVDFGVTWLCKEKLGLNKYLSNSLGFILAATNNYIWNRVWTFQSTNSNISAEYGKFFLVSLAGLGINNLIIYLLHGKLNLNFYLSKVFAIGVVMFWNFTMNYFFTF